MSLSRREFLSRSAGGVTLAAASLSFPSIFARTARAAAAAPAAVDDRILVVLQLTGGNDGLSTVVPLRDEHYRRLRPTLAIGRNEALRLSDEVGLCPQLAPLRELFDEGWLTVVQGVGYPNPNRSHFESMDIWHCCDPSLARRETGWLGRAIEREPGLSALHLDDAALPLALRAERVDVPSVASIESFRLPGRDDARVQRAIEAVTATPPVLSAEAATVSDAEYIRRTAVSACENARRLEGLPAQRPAGYPSYGLARRLSEIARLIAADFGPRIYYTSLAGFDTHARQKTVHPNLMSELGGSVKAFFDDLRERRLAERVVLMTFSEFGRRAEENASLGTDHGAAAPLLLAGPSARGGLLGPTPDLGRLVDGDVPHALDFRQVYATLLQDWLRLPSRAILGGDFERLPLLR